MKNAITFFNNKTKKTEILYNFCNVDYMLDYKDEWVYRVLCDSRYYYFDANEWTIIGIEVY